MTLWFHSFLSVFQNLRITCRQSLTLLWALCFHRSGRPDQYHPANSATVGRVRKIPTREVNLLPFQQEAPVKGIVSESLHSNIALPTHPV